MFTDDSSLRSARPSQLTFGGRTMSHVPRCPAVWVTFDGPHRDRDDLDHVAFFGTGARIGSVPTGVVTNPVPMLLGKRLHRPMYGFVDAVAWGPWFAEETACSSGDLSAEVHRRHGTVLSNLRVEASVLGAGDYHPRMWRLGSPDVRDTPSEAGYLTGCTAAFGLIEHMRAVFRVIEPVPENEHAYGHEIRELLILACTEVENAWRGILDANGYAAKKPNSATWNRSDYVKLCPPLRLNEYTVQLTLHPRWPEVRPFANWSNTPGSLPWYDAYNATKHDRDGKFRDGSLANAVTAVAAVFVLMVAQYGPLAFGGPGSRLTSNEFTVTAQPDHVTRQTVFIPALRDYGVPWTPVPYFSL